MSNAEQVYNNARTGGTISEEGLRLLAIRNGCTLEELKAFLNLPPTSTIQTPAGTVFTCAGERTPGAPPHLHCYQDTVPSNPTYVACPICQTDAFTVLGDTVPAPRWVDPSSSSIDPHLAR